MESNFDILGISENSSFDDIHKAFRKLALIHHPDRGGQDEQFKKIRRAYEDLMEGKKYPDTLNEGKKYPDTLNEGKTIVQAIHEKKLLRFEYHGYDRIAEPHIYGSRNGRAGILVYQVRGKSSSKKLGWRCMYLDKMYNVSILDETFPGAREDSESHSIWNKIHTVVS